MTEDWAKLQKRYPWLKPWVPIAALLAVGILGYYGWLGMRYFNASVQTNSLAGQSVPAISQASDEIMKADVESQQQRLTDIIDAFGSSRGSDLIAVVAELAREHDLALDSIAIEKPVPESLGEFRVTALSMSVLVRGEKASVYDFVSALSLKVPMAVTKFQMDNLGNSDLIPSAQLSVLFYQSPDLASEEDEE
ncbi:MAG: hypothetical protein IH956_03380 [Chloroflexi bacterium]|nr:hypothetical protein [Chloroflexota bacterium]